MIELDVPGRGLIQLEHLVTDVNGTIAKDGRLLEKIARPLVGLKDRLQIHLITANTYGRQDNIDLMLALKAVRLKGENQAEQFTVTPFEPFTPLSTFCAACVCSGASLPLT